jgi:serine protease Do
MLLLPPGPAAARLLPAVAALAAPEGELSLARTVYERAAPAVVGIACLLDRPGLPAPEPYYGTGTLIDPSGLVLSSVTVVPPGARSIRVFLAGGRLYSASLLHTDPGRELALLELDRKAAEDGKLPHLKLGDSRSVRVGEPAFSLGNAFHSIEEDDQVSMSQGIVSGLFHLSERQSLASYLGPTLETSAAINSGMDGGALLDGHGQLIGLLSLNYSRNRWLGTAVPVHVLKPEISKFRGWLDDRDEPFAAYAGLELEEIARREVRVLRVREPSPAREAGMMEGDIIERIEGEAPASMEAASMEAVRRAFSRSRPGGVLRLQTAREGARRDVELILWGKY